MRIQPKNYQEAMNLVYNILNQGDSRYNAPEDEKILAGFLINEAIFLEENPFPRMEEPNQEDISKHSVQGWEKQIAQAILKTKGFDNTEIFFEKRFYGYVPDVLAEKESLTIIVECCSCKTSKIIDYLSKAEEVWVLTRGEKPWEEKPLFDKMQWFVFKRGSNWERIYSSFQKKTTEELKKIQSPIDSL